MCGILGGYHSSTFDRRIFESMRDEMVHRGPDGAGGSYFKGDRIALGHRRLSIIDLSDDGQQPMPNEDESLWLSFNGEIYNHIALRKELMALGHRFRSKMDGEVLLHGFEAWGLEGLLERLSGMFSFGIYDQKSEKFYCARDRFGIKPFVYYYDGASFVFASEIKALLKAPFVNKEIRPTFFADFMNYGYIPHPNSPWKHIKKLPPGNSLTFSVRDKSLEIKPYYVLRVSNTRVSEAEATEKSTILLQNAVKSHLTSDVPVGLFLSGGYDSTSILHYTKMLGYDLDSYTLGFTDSKNSEHHLAKEIAAIYNTPNHAGVLKKDENYWEVLKEQSNFYDEPYAISSMMPYYYISKLASKNHKVILGGDGGDEVFGGYRWYNVLNNRSLKTKFKDIIVGKEDRLLDSYNRHMPGLRKWEEALAILKGNQLVSPSDAGNLDYFKQHYRKEVSLIKRFQLLDIKTFMLEACLMRADQTSMIHSLEIRLPFLEHTLVEYLMGLSQKTYFNSSQKKILMYNQLANKLPENVLSEPKRGFGFQHLSHLFGNEFEDAIHGGELEKLDLIHKNTDWKSVSVQTKFFFAQMELWCKRFSI